MRLLERQRAGSFEATRPHKGSYSLCQSDLTPGCLALSSKMVDNTAVLVHNMIMRDLTSAAKLLGSRGGKKTNTPQHREYMRAIGKSNRKPDNQVTTHALYKRDYRLGYRKSKDRPAQNIRKALKALQRSAHNSMIPR